MRILLTGKTGQVGRELIPLLQQMGPLLAVGRDECDLVSEDTMARIVRDFRPDVIVNSAAYTAVNDAESNVEMAYAVNAKAPGILASLARESSALFIHYSTDYVFDGTKSGPWIESDPPAPLNVYGASKLEGENAVSAVGGRYLVLRTSWVYGTHGTNFLLTIRKLVSEREELKVVSDQFGAPTSSRQIARATAQLVAQLSSNAEVSAGVYHMTAAGVTSWFGFAEAIVAALCRSQELRLRRLVPITSAEFPTPAKRPSNSQLNNQKFKDTFGFRLGGWYEGLNEIMASLSPSNRSATLG